MNTTTKQTTSKRNKWAVRILTTLVILPFAMSGIMKLTQAQQVIDGFTAIGIPAGAVLPIGIVELLCLALYLTRRTVVLGTLLLTGYLGGAVLANIIMKGDFLHALAIGGLVWAGAWLRVPAFRTLIFPSQNRTKLHVEIRYADAPQPEDYSVAVG